MHFNESCARSLADYEDDPLRLVGQLVQEDFFLLVEEDCVWNPDGPKYAAELGGDPSENEANTEGVDAVRNTQPTKTAGGTGEDTSKDAWLPQGAEEWAELHPSGKQHTFNAAAACFSFDPRPKHLQDMSVIHHPGVGQFTSNPPLLAIRASILTGRWGVPTGGWVFHLQRGMNRLFADMRHHGSVSNGAMDPSSVGWYRHNFGFNLVRCFSVFLCDLQ